MNPRIYVASLSDYNSGRLLGAWIRANQPADDIRKDIAAMLTDSTEPVAEEWAIHDTDGFGSYTVSEYEDLDTLVEIAEGIAEHGDALSAWMGNSPGYNTPANFTDHYIGTYDSFKDYAYEYVEATCLFDGVDDSITNYFDWDSYANDLAFDFTVIEDGSSVYVFSDR